MWQIQDDAPQRRWLYSTHHETAWMVGGEDEHEVDFKCDEGFISNGHSHNGVMPNKFVKWFGHDSHNDDWGYSPGITCTAVGAEAYETTELARNSVPRISRAPSGADDGARTEGAGGEAQTNVEATLEDDNMSTGSFGSLFSDAERDEVALRAKVAERRPIIKNNIPSRVSLRVWTPGRQVKDDLNDLSNKVEERVVSAEGGVPLLSGCATNSPGIGLKLFKGTKVYVDRTVRNKDGAIRCHIMAYLEPGVGTYSEVKDSEGNKIEGWASKKLLVGGVVKEVPRKLVVNPRTRENEKPPVDEPPRINRRAQRQLTANWKARSRTQPGGGESGTGSHSSSDASSESSSEEEAETKKEEKEIALDVEPGDLGATIDPTTGSVSDIQPGGQFETLGVKEGWRIIWLGDDEFSEEMLASYRDESEEGYTITISTAPPPKEIALDVEPGDLGGTVDPNTGSVSDIQAGGQFERLGVKDGWRITWFGDDEFSEEQLASYQHESEEGYTITFEVAAGDDEEGEEAKVGTAVEAFLDEE
jgi:hypothetical protein